MLLIFFLFFQNDNILYEDNFPDKALLTALQQRYPKGLSHEEAKAIDALPLSNREISDLTGLELFSNLSWINLDHNNLSDITPLDQLPIVRLELNYNRLSSTDKIPTTVVNLKLSWNTFTHLDISHLINLVELEASWNQISSFVPNPQLLSLNLSNNVLSEVVLPLQLFTLRLGNNRLSKITALDEFKNLETLDLSYNYIENFNKLPTSLVSLNLEENPLCNLGTLPNTITDLFLNNTLLKDLPLLPTNLIFLECRNIGLTHLPDLSKTNLRWLLCDGNQLTHLNYLPASLVALQAYDNLLESIDNFPPNLFTIKLNMNQLSTLPNWENLSSLTSINVSYNNLETIPNLPSSVTGISASDNNLSETPSLKNLQNLTSLDISNNSIESVDHLIELPWLGSHESHNINIENNLISNCDVIQELNERTTLSGATLTYSPQNGQIINCATSDKEIEAWIPHITKENSAFETDLVLYRGPLGCNLITFFPYDHAGLRLGEFSVNLNTFQDQYELNPNDLFPGASHLGFSCNNDYINVMTRYRLKGRPETETFISTDRATRRRHTFRPSHRQQFFDAIVLLNTGEKSTTVYAGDTLYSFFNIINVNAVLAQRLPPKGKVTLLVDDLNWTPGTPIFVEATEPIQVVYLRGTMPGVEPAALFEVAPSNISTK